MSLGWISDTANVHDDAFVKDTRNESSFRKVHSEVKASDQDGYSIVMLTSTIRSKRTARS